jgi:hypothetical protein
VFCLLLLCLIAGAFTQSLTDAQKLDQAVSLAQSVVCESDTCKTRQKDVVTRLTNLKFYLPATTPVPPPPPPVYVTQSVFEALVARVAKLETAAPAPTPVPVPTPTPTTTPIPQPPPTGGANAYFDALKAGANVQSAYAIRTTEEIAKYNTGGYPVKVTYDAANDAARWQWNTNDGPSAEQLRFPIALTRPASGTSSLLIVADFKWDTGWMTEFNTTTGKIDGWKWLQVTDVTSPTGTRPSLWFEPQMRFIGAAPSLLSYFGARAYKGARAPSAIGATTCGAFRLFDTVTPMQCFAAKPNTWTRLWLQITETAGQPVATISMWMADETQEPTQVLNAVEIHSDGNHQQFWIEYNSSWDVRAGGPMAAWARNVLVLKDAQPILHKPVR